MYVEISKKGMDRLRDAKARGLDQDPRLWLLNVIAVMSDEPCGGLSQEIVDMADGGEVIEFVEEGQ